MRPVARVIHDHSSSKPAPHIGRSQFAGTCEFVPRSHPSELTQPETNGPRSSAETCYWNWVLQSGIATSHRGDRGIVRIRLSLQSMLDLATHGASTLPTAGLR